MTKEIYEKMEVKAILPHQIIWVIEFKTQTTSGKKICVFTLPIEILNVKVEEKIGNPVEVQLDGNIEP